MKMFLDFQAFNRFYLYRLELKSVLNTILTVLLICPKVRSKLQTRGLCRLCISLHLK